MSYFAQNISYTYSQVHMLDRDQQAQENYHKNIWHCHIWFPQLDMDALIDTLPQAIHL